MKNKIYKYKKQFFLIVFLPLIFSKKINAEEKISTNFNSNVTNFKIENQINSKIKFNKELLIIAQEAIRLFGDKISKEAQDDILLQRVVIGMSPYEAKLAAGAFYYKVKADSKIWPDRSDPLIVIDRQSLTPDESEIWMTFETETQSPGEGKNRFKVYFVYGKAVAITKIVN